MTEAAVTPRDKIEQVLASIRPALRSDGGDVELIDFDEEDKVHIQFLLKQEDPGTLVREVRAAAEAVEGVARVKIDVKLPTAPQQQKARRGVAAKGTVPAPTPNDALKRSI